MGATTIYLVRHAHADWQRDEDRPLSEDGLKASHVLGTLLSGLPITAVYSSPVRRAVETVTPLADRLGIRPELMHDLRERELPVVPSGEFDRIVSDTWHSPESATVGAESNAKAQTRGLAAVRRILTRHVGQHVVVSTHGNLLALILNGLDSAFGYDFWRRLSFPDIYRLEFEGSAMTRVERIWDRAA
jgi:broad specificity phosphatase PhoE